MATPETKVRLSHHAAEALKRLVVRFPEWSEAQIASKLLVEACAAALGEKPVTLPTVVYMRGETVEQKDQPLTEGRLLEILRLQGALPALRVAEDPPQYLAKAPGRRAARK